MKNLDYVIGLVQVDLDDFSTARYQKYLSYALMGLRDLELYSMPSVKVEHLKLSDGLTAPLPPDYEYYTKIGMCINGQIWTLSVNKSLCLSQRLTECGLEDQEFATTDVNSILLDNSTTAIFRYAPHFRHGQMVGEMFSIGGGYNELGYFRIDHRMNQIQFASTVPKADIILEYKSTGATDGSAVIPAAAIEPIRAYIHWQLVEHDRSVGDGTKERKRGIYRTEHQKIRDLNLSITMDEYLDSTYESYKSTVKR